MTDTVVVTTPDTTPAALDPTLTDAVSAALAYSSSAQNAATSASNSASLAAASATSAASNAAACYNRTTVLDADRTGTTSDIFVVFRTLTAARTYSLPSANAYPAGRPLVICDGSGSCSPSNKISISLTGTDTFVGGSTTPLALTAPGASIILESNGNGAWVVISRRTNASQTFSGTTGTISVGTEYAAVTVISAPCALTLPAASSFPKGGLLVIADESGACTATNTITLNRAGSDTIIGLNSIVMQIPYQVLQLRSNGSNLWLVQ